MNKDKPSKNSRCPCGSGKKYRKCCRAKKPPPSPSPSLIAEVVRRFKEQDDKRQHFNERYGHARVPVCCKMGDKWVVVVGGNIYKQTQEGPYGFMNFIHDNALNFFSVSFLEAEEAKPFEKRHPAIQWMHTYVEHSQRLMHEGNRNPRAGQIGSGAAWFRFAYDLFTIGDNAKLEARLKERLLESKSFQAARHELRVAALCVVAGFDLQFEDEQDNSRRHPEFIATDKFSSVTIAVEVKSRHRKGVQGFESGRDIKPGDQVDIRQPVTEAYKKNSSLPFYVFVDTNLPPVEDDLIWERWMLEMNKTMFDLQEEGYADPCPANIVFFSNDPSHYLAEEHIGNVQDRLWIKHYMATSPRVPHPDCNMAERFIKAHAQRLAPPSDFPDFN
jgi:SEC-C motif